LLFSTEINKMNWIYFSIEKYKSSVAKMGKKLQKSGTP
jgi:hypothetical protein